MDDTLTIDPPSPGDDTVFQTHEPSTGNATARIRDEPRAHAPAFGADVVGDEAVVADRPPIHGEPA